MRQGKDHTVIGIGLRCRSQWQPIFLLYICRIHPWVMHVYVYSVVLQFRDYIHHTCVAQVRTVFLERQPEDQHPRAVHLKTAFQHRLDQLAGHIRAHPVIDTPPGQDDLRVIAYRLGLVGQVIRVHPDAVPADQPRLERQEIPFCACRFQNRIGVDPHLVEDHRQFIHERNV